MEANWEQNKQAKCEEEYVLLDLDGACLLADIPPNAPYVLSVSAFFGHFFMHCVNLLIEMERP